MTATIFFFMLALHCVCIGTFKKLLHTFQFIEFQALFLTPAVSTRTRISTTEKKKKKMLGKNFSTQLEFFCWCTLKLLSSQSKIPLFTFSVSYLAIFFFFEEPSFIRLPLKDPIGESQQLACQQQRIKKNFCSTSMSLWHLNEELLKPSP